MYELITMGVALIVFVALLRLKIKIGLSMIIASIVLQLLLRVSPLSLYDAFKYEWQTKPLDQTTGYLFVTLASLVSFVSIMGLAMQEANISQRLAPALQTLFRSRRFAMCAIPLLMGLLPTPGGIMLSAPMVRDLGDSIGVNRTRTAAINFFFRHQWETIWPIFPAIPLIQGMLGISALSLIKHNIIITLMGICGGSLFLLSTGIPPKDRRNHVKEKWSSSLNLFLQAFAPIALVATLHILFNISPAVGILLSLLLFFLYHKIPFKRWGDLFKAGFELDFVFLILGALLFKLDLQAANSIAAIVEFFSSIHMPAGVVLFILPMLVAGLTGLTMPTVAITFPLLLPFIVVGDKVNIGYQTLAFSGLICGLFLTPVHLCLSMSVSYFQTSLGRIIALLVGPILFIAAAGILAATLFR